VGYDLFLFVYLVAMELSLEDDIPLKTPDERNPCDDTILMCWILIVLKKNNLKK